jgi:hypothetical protein
MKHAPRALRKLRANTKTVIPNPFTGEGSAFHAESAKTNREEHAKNSVPFVRARLQPLRFVLPAAPQNAHNYPEGRGFSPAVNSQQKQGL